MCCTPFAHAVSQIRRGPQPLSSVLWTANTDSWATGMEPYFSNSSPGRCRGSLRIPVGTRICCAVVMRFLFTVARTRSLCRVLAMARVRTWGRSLLVVGTTSAMRAATSSSLTWSASWTTTGWGYSSFYSWNNLNNFRPKKNQHCLS